MKKMHDQLLRNIQDILESHSGSGLKSEIQVQLLKSYALPAHYYAGFKTIKDVYTIVWNEQNNQMLDLAFLAQEALRILASHSFKQLRLPQDFYKQMVHTFSGIKVAFEYDAYNEVKHILNQGISYIETEYSHAVIRTKYAQWKEEHPDATENEEWKAYRKLYYFHGRWLYLSLFRGFMRQLEKNVEYQDMYENK